MRYHGKEEHYLLGLSLNELKVLYRSIWADLKARGQMGIDEEASDLLYDLQVLLQQEAQRCGVDVALHSEWAAFVGLDDSCKLR